MDRYTQSARFYKLALKHDPKDSAVYEKLGNLYYRRMKLPHLGAKYYRKAIKFNGHQSSYYVNLEAAEAELGNVSACVKDLENAILYKPDSEVLYDRLGKLYLDQGDKKNAKRSLSYFGRAIQLSSSNRTGTTNEDYYYHRGLAKLKLHDYKGSIADMKAGAECAPGEEFRYHCANMYNVKGIRIGSKDPINARKYYLSSLALIKDPVVYYNLALANKDMQRTNVAIQCAKKGLKLDKNCHVCRKLINQLQPKLKNGVKAFPYDPNVNYMDKLDQMIGLTSVKRQIKRYVDVAAIHKVRTGKPGHGEIHLVLEGNPGTGKTTVAKLLCGILYQKHVIDKKKFILANSTQLIGWRYGEGAKNIRKLINKAKGGVLFIDEAYHLRHRTDGNSAVQDEIVAELLPDIEKYRNDLVVIMAGYTHAMEKFLKRSNPGLGSRFPDRIKFPDYTADECRQIMALDLRNNNLCLASKSTKQLLDKELNGYISADRSNPDHIFANARTVRNVYKALKAAFSCRLTNRYTMSQLDLYKQRGYKLLNTITKDDVKRAFKEYDLGRDDKSATQQLNGMIGLKNVKHLVKSFVDQVTVHKIRTGQATHDGMNMVFEGNPGTGKTTVAKLFCKILYQRGITKSPNYVYVSATHLLSPYVGQGAANVRRAFRKAKNGVLFIDEAYALDNAGDKGTVDQLISDVSKYKNKIVIILAGYQESMENFLNGANDGLSSRFPERINFNDYTNDECFKILTYDFKNSGLRVNSAKAKRVLKTVFTSYISVMRRKGGRHFANARTVNNFFKRLCHSFDDRISSHTSVDKLRAWKRSGNKRLNTVNLMDIKETNRKVRRLEKLVVDAGDYNGTSIGFMNNGTVNKRTSTKSMDV